MAKSKSGPRRGLFMKTVSITPVKVWWWFGIRLGAFGLIHTLVHCMVPAHDRPQAITAYLVCAWMFLGRSVSHRLGARVHVLALAERRLNRTAVSHGKAATPEPADSNWTLIKLTFLTAVVLIWLEVYEHSLLVARPDCWVNQLSGGELTLVLNAAKWAMGIQITIWVLTMVRRQHRSGGFLPQSDLDYPVHPVHGTHEYAPTLFQHLRRGHPDAPLTADA